MGIQHIGTLIDRWLGDQQFRGALRKDAEAAIRTTGITLTADEWDVVRGIDWTMTDEQLKARVSKGM